MVPEGKMPTMPNHSSRRRWRPALEALEDRCLLTAGFLEPTFDGDGRQTIAFDLGGSQQDSAAAVVVQPDGKIVLAGSTAVGSNNNDFAVVRLNPDGTPDVSFDGDSRQVIPFDVGSTLARDDQATAMALQPDGKIVLAGFAQVGGSNYDIALARLNVNGSLDTTFDGDGKLTLGIEIGATKDDRAFAVAVQPDGKIVVAGYVNSTTADDNDFVVLRFNPNGSLDLSFSNGGMRFIPFNVGPGGMRDDQARSLALLPDGSIVVAGFAQSGAVTTGNHDFAVARLTPTGLPDTTFDNDGRRTIPFEGGSSRDDRAYAVRVQTDGRIVLAGAVNTGVGNDYGFGIARLTVAGELDATFDGDGLQLVKFDQVGAGEHNDQARALALQADGKLVVAGFSQASSGDVSFAVARLTTSGTLDTSFAGAGKTEVGFNLGGSNADRAAGLAIQPDGDLVLVGSAERSSPAGNRDFALARLVGDPWIVTAPDEGGPPLVRLYSPAGGRYREFFAYGDTFRAGVRVVVADLTGDGYPDLVTAPGPGGQPFVNVFEGRTLRLERQHQVYGITFTLGVHVAVGDVTGNGAPEIVVAPDAGGEPFVNVVDSQGGQQLLSFLAYGRTFTGGVRLALANTHGDNHLEILTAPQAGGAPFVNQFDGTTGSFVRQVQVYGEAFTGGIFLAAGEFTGGGFTDLAIGPGAGGAPFVNLFEGSTGQFLRQFQAYGDAFLAGVRVGAVDVNADGISDVATGPGHGGAPFVKLLDGLGRGQVGLFLAYDQGMTSGLFVVGAPR